MPSKYTASAAHTRQHVSGWMYIYIYIYIEKACRIAAHSHVRRREMREIACQSGKAGSRTWEDHFWASLEHALDDWLEFVRKQLGLHCL